MSGVLVVLEHRGGGYNRMSWEALAAGQQIASASGQPLSAAIVGNDLEALSAELAGKKLIKKLDPGYVVFPHTYQVRDFAPRLATRFGQVLLADLVGLRKDGDTFVFVRQL